MLKVRVTLHGCAKSGIEQNAIKEAMEITKAAVRPTFARGREWIFRMAYRVSGWDVEMSNDYTRLDAKAEARKNASPTLPEDFDFVNHLSHPVQPGDCGLCQLFQIEAGHLAVKIERRPAKFAPYSLDRQVRLLQKAVPRRGGDQVASSLLGGEIPLPRSVPRTCPEIVPRLACNRMEWVFWNGFQLSAIHD